jgi:hypothetical protein
MSKDASNNNVEIAPEKSTPESKPQNFASPSAN